MFGWAYQYGLSAVEQCFFLTANQPQPAYKQKKIQPAEQGHQYACFINLIKKKNKM
jgi:hypothetical protein